jgi:hypothetical protein
MGKDNASVAKSLKKSGFYDAGKSKSERIGIINDVTTKPQRLEMVDKLFLAKSGKGVQNADKDKKFSKGGLHLSVGGNKALPDSKKITPKGHVRYNNKTGNW